MPSKAAIITLYVLYLALAPRLNLGKEYLSNNIFKQQQ